MKKIFLMTIVFLVTVSAWCFVVSPWLNRVPPINEATKTCLITGASSGIGYEIAREMVARGWKVIGVARREENLKKVAQKLGDSFTFYVCDTSKPEQVRAVSEQIKKDNFKPTLFFLNVGVGTIEQPYVAMFNAHKQMFDTNYFGVITWVDEWLSFVKALSGGTFVATSSVAALFSGPCAAGYGASKAALNASFKALRLRYRKDKIGFVVVMPGPVATDILKTDKPLPFTHQPTEEAHHIVQRVFAGKKQIEPSWYYSSVVRILTWLPDALVLKMLN